MKSIFGLNTNSTQHVEIMYDASLFIKLKPYKIMINLARTLLNTIYTCDNDEVCFFNNLENFFFIGYSKDSNKKIYISDNNNRVVN